MAGAKIPISRYLANLGYGSRREVEIACRRKRVSVNGKILTVPREKIDPEQDVILFDEEALDPPMGMVIALNKPAGYICSHTEDPSVFDLLPGRFRQRSPALSCVGRLDKDTTGILLLTDDGAFLHHLISPKKHQEKLYHVTVADDFSGEEEALFASGQMMLKSETSPLLPAKFVKTGDKTAEVTLTEGRYHQVKRMFGACGNKVTGLHRASFAGVPADTVAEGTWRFLSPDEIVALKQATGYSG